MTTIQTRQLRARIRKQARTDRGLTVIELLVAMTLMILLTGALAGGLHIIRSAYVSDQRFEAAAEADHAAQIIAEQIGTAFPTGAKRRNPSDFSGSSKALQFIRMDNGNANRSGLHLATIRKVDNEVMLALAPGNDVADTEKIKVVPVTLARNVDDIEFQYFGSTSRMQMAAWHSEWSSNEQLPDLISIQIRFKGLPQAATQLVVALRQK